MIPADERGLTEEFWGNKRARGGVCGHGRKLAASSSARTAIHVSTVRQIGERQGAQPPVPDRPDWQQYRRLALPLTWHLTLISRRIFRGSVTELSGRSVGKSRWIPSRAQTAAGPANVGENQQVAQNAAYVHEGQLPRFVEKLEIPLGAVG